MASAVGIGTTRGRIDIRSQDRTLRSELPLLPLITASFRLCRIFFGMVSPPTNAATYPLPMPSSASYAKTGSGAAMLLSNTTRVSRN